MKNIKTYEEFKNITFKEYLKKWSDDSLLSIELTCSGFGLLDLNGVEQFKNLRIFSCRINHITSLEPLKNSINLEELYCWDNKISSLKPILNLTKLRILYCDKNPIDWVDYIDKQGNKWYIVLPKSIEYFLCDDFNNLEEYNEFMDQNQPASVSRKFNF